MAEAVEKTSEDVNCAVCMDTLTDARYLKCFHSFCTRCLEHCVRNSKVSCPLCRETTNVSKGIDSLLPNLTATRRVKGEKIREKIETKIQDEGCQCESCKELGAVCLAKSYCVDCQLLICDKCVSAHKLLKMTRNHRIISVLEFQTSKADVTQEEKFHDEGVRETKCDKHGVALTMFCRPCKVFVCPQCALRDHRNELDEQRCVSISEIRDELVEEVKQILSKMDLNDFDRISESYKRRLKDVSEKAQDLRLKINESAQKEVACLYAKIEAKRTELVTRVQDVEKTSCRKVTNVLTGIRRLRSRAEKLDGYAGDLMKMDNPTGIMASKDILADQIKELRIEMRKLVTNDPDIRGLDGYFYTATDWMATSYEAGLGRLETCDLGDVQDESQGRVKRRIPGRPSRTAQRPSTSLPQISNNRGSLVH